jgi:hypothetical protein
MNSITNNTQFKIFSGFLIFPACINQPIPLYTRFLTLIPKHAMILDRKDVSHILEPGFS